MRRLAVTVTVAIAACLLAGCVYDPYTGTYVPCCNQYGYYYGSPYYHYPPPYAPYGYPPAPYWPPPQAQPGGGYPGYPGAPGPGAAAYPRQGDPLAQRFAAANVTHDGRLTQQQAAAAMPLVAQNFDAIDIDHKGYVTLPEIRAFATQRRAELGQAGQLGVP